MEPSAGRLLWDGLLVGQPVTVQVTAGASVLALLLSLTAGLMRC